uniref:hypothetical protein n=1 Tax=Ruegeria conchae TaxID=981384 RepID=UPI00056A9677
LPQPGYRHKDWATIQPVPYDPDDYSYSEDKTFYDETDYRLRYDKPYSIGRRTATAITAIRLSRRSPIPMARTSCVT